MSDMDTGDPGPPRRTGLPWYAKLAVGCVLLSLLGIGACFGLGLWGVKSVRNVARDDWARLARVADQLATEEGARALWGAEPGLHREFLTEEAFVAHAAAIRPYLPELPPEPPSLLSGELRYEVSVDNGRRRAAIAYVTGGRGVRARFEEDALVEVGRAE